MSDVWEVRPRWWRLDPESQIEISWAREEDFDDWRLDEPLRLRGCRPCISIRQYRQAPVGWTPAILYGPWRTFDLLRYQAPDGHKYCALTRVVDGEPILEIHALEAPSLGTWHEIEPTLTEQAA
ncbi:hypothetical protein ACFYY5_29100 [Nocardia elegans]|uniref:Uncharacterized protein n=1 Tax=Nocardia elegans TaxID=300029 RepID=A0ABW6TLA9_9NOCA